MGIADSLGGIAFRFSDLEITAPTLSIVTIVDGQPVTVLWDALAQTAGAYLPQTIDGEAVTIQLVDGRFVDAETGSEWGVNGWASSGPRQGQQLRQHPGSYVAYWFGWASFYPRTRLWLGK